MRKSWKRNQHTNGFGLNQSTLLSVWQIAALMLFGVVVSMKLQPKIISPLSDTPIIPIVYAAPSVPKYDVPSLILQMTGRHAGTLSKIANCESGYRQNAISHTNDWGVFQISLVYHKDRVPGQTMEEKRQWLLDPRNNILFAYNLYLTQGSRPWNASKICWTK